MAKKIEVQIVADASSYQRAMRDAGGATAGFGSKLGRMGKTAALSAGSAGLGALTYTLRAGVGEWLDSQKVMAQTMAVLKSTGGAANVTAKDITTLSESLMKKSGVDDEAIQSGANLLLTFTKIQNKAGEGNKIFDRATKATLDMSVALGTDMKSAAIQVGKALNDPLKGVTALQRAGVSFTAAQKEQIKTLVESGKTMEAQKLILGELTTQFGGSAEAIGKTLPGQINILRESFNNLAGQGVAIAVAKLQELAPTFRTIADVIGKVVPIVAGFMEALFTVVVTPLKVIAALIRGDWAAAWDALKAPVIAARQAVEPLIDAIKVAVDIAWNAISTLTRTVWDAVSAKVTTVVTAIKTAVSTGVAAIQLALTTAWNAIQTVTTTVWNAVQLAITTAINAVRTVVTTGVSAVQTALTTAWNAISTVTTTVWTAIQTKVTSAINAVRTAVTIAVNEAKTALTTAWNAIQAATNTVWNAVSAKVAGVVSAITTAAQTMRDVVIDVFEKIRDAVGPIAGAINGILGGISGTLGGIAGAAISAYNAIMKLKSVVGGVFAGDGTGFGKFPDGRAVGGPVAAGRTYLVGERGPELFRPNHSGMIIPNNRLGSGSSAGKTVNVTVTQPVQVPIDERQLAAWIRRAETLAA